MCSLCRILTEDKIVQDYNGYEIWKWYFEGSGCLSGELPDITRKHVNKLNISEHWLLPKMQYLAPQEMIRGEESLKRKEFNFND